MVVLMLILAMMMIMVCRIVEEEVEEGDRLALWEKKRLLEEQEEEEARLSDTRVQEKSSSERKSVDPSKAAELTSLVERLARVAAIPPPSPPSSDCRTPPTPSGIILSLYSTMTSMCDTPKISYPTTITTPTVEPHPVPTCIGHTGLLGPRRKQPRKLVMMILFAFEVIGYFH